jgi:hypothetical protein
MKNVFLLFGFCVITIVASAQAEESLVTEEKSSGWVTVSYPEPVRTTTVSRPVRTTPPTRVAVPVTPPQPKATVPANTTREPEPFEKTNSRIQRFKKKSS